MRGNDFFLDPANFQNPSPQSDFSGHTDKPFDRNSGERRNQRSRDCGSSTRPILGYGTFWHMNMYINLLKEFFWKREDLPVTTYIGKRCLTGFFHDFTQVSSQNQLTFARNQGHF